MSTPTNPQLRDVTAAKALLLQTVQSLPEAQRRSFDGELGGVLKFFDKLAGSSNTGESSRSQAHMDLSFFTSTSSSARGHSFIDSDGVETVTVPDEDEVVVKVEQDFDHEEEVGNDDAHLNRSFSLFDKRRAAAAAASSGRKDVLEQRKGRGRPRKVLGSGERVQSKQTGARRGRPPKHFAGVLQSTSQGKRRGRPPGSRVSVASVHDDENECTYCGKKFMSGSTLALHAFKFHGVPLFEDASGQSAAPRGRRQVDYAEMDDGRDSESSFSMLNEKQTGERRAGASSEGDRSAGEEAPSAKKTGKRGRPRKVVAENELAAAVEHDEKPSIKKGRRPSKTVGDNEAVVSPRRSGRPHRRSSRLPADEAEEVEDEMDEPVAKVEYKEESAMKCESCQKRLKTENGLVIHMAKFHNAPLPEDIKRRLERQRERVRLKLAMMASADSRLESGDSAVAAAALAAEEPQELRCEACRKVFKKRTGLALHLHKYHGGPQPPPSAYKMMAESTKREKTLACDQCEQLFTTEGHLAKHAARVHGREDLVGPALCDQCGHVCKNAWQLLSHVQRVHSEEPVQPERNFGCAQCSAFFTTQLRLRHHFRRNHIPLNLVCTICGHVAKNIELFRSHSYVHGERKFSCPTCKASFKHPAYVRQHVKLWHLKIRPFKCKQCERRFYNSTNLKDHCIRVHVPDGKLIRPHRCPNCPRRFVTFHNLKNHLKRNVCDKTPRKRDYFKHRATGTSTGAYTESKNVLFPMVPTRRRNRPVPGSAKQPRAPRRLKTEAIMPLRIENEEFSTIGGEATSDDIAALEYAEVLGVLDEPPSVIARGTGGTHLLPIEMGSADGRTTTKYLLLGLSPANVVRNT